MNRCMDHATTRSQLDRSRDELRDRVLAAIAKPPSTDEGRPVLGGETLTIACDVRPFASPEAADAAEETIDWHGDVDAGEACRVGFAAMELAKYLRRLAPGSRVQFVHGPAEGLQDAIELCRPSEVVGELSSEGFRWDADLERRRISITGGSGVGILYGVYELIEHWGVRFHAPGEVHLPNATRLTLPNSRVCRPGFEHRSSYSFRRNRATPELLDWMGQNRLNLWGADDRVPGMRKRGIRLMSGNHDLLPVLGLPTNFCIHDPAQREHLVRRVLHEYMVGMWREADVVDYIGGDWAKRCECDACRRAGTATDVELQIVHVLRHSLRELFLAGRINRDLPVSWYAYFDTVAPPRSTPPAEFDYRNCFGALWSMRCWIHTVDDPTCDETMRRRSKMESSCGQIIAEPTNAEINAIFRAWNGGGSFNGTIGVGMYLYNAGLYWLPIPYQAILVHEIPYYRRAGASFIGMMHLAPSDWGPKAVSYGLWARLAWDPQVDGVSWLADYYRTRYGVQAPLMCRLYFLLEEMLANMYNLRRILVPALVEHWSDGEDIFSYEHLNGRGRGAGHDLATMADVADQAGELIAQATHTPTTPAIERDRAWVDYSVDAVRLLHAVCSARDVHRTQGDWAPAGIWVERARDAARRLHANRLPISLPGKPIVTPYQASGLTNVVAGMASATHVELDALAEVMPKPVRVDLQPADSGVTADTLVTAAVRDSTSPRDSPPQLPLSLESLSRVVSRVLCAVPFASGACAVVSDLGRGGVELLCTGLAGERWRREFACGPDGTSVVAAGAKVVLAGSNTSRRGIVFAIDTMLGETVWQVLLDRCENAGPLRLAHHGGLVVVCDRMQLTVIELETGRPLWSWRGAAAQAPLAIGCNDVNGDGQPEVLAVYRSSGPGGMPQLKLSVFDAAGRLLWERLGIDGSIPAIAPVTVDIDGDGRHEILVAANGDGRSPAWLTCLESYGGYFWDPLPINRTLLGLHLGRYEPFAIAVTEAATECEAAWDDWHRIDLRDSTTRWCRSLRRRGQLVGTAQLAASTAGVSVWSTTNGILRSDVQAVTFDGHVLAPVTLAGQVSVAGAAAGAAVLTDDSGGLWLLR